MKTPHYIVPIDFSAVTENALISAARFFKAENPTIIALHIVSSKSDTIAAKLKMEELIDSLPLELQEIIEPRVVVGDLFSDIGKAAEILDARLIIMGTHGARGMQKIFGSNALRLVGSTNTPFLILQDEVQLTKIKNIVMPFNFEAESIQVINYAAYLAKKYDAQINLLGHHNEDEWLRGKSFGNQNIIRKLLDDNQIDYVIENLYNSTSKSYIPNILEYAKRVDADIIAASFFGDSLFQNVNPHIQPLIENDLQIPFLTVNAEQMTIAHWRTIS